MDVGLRSQNPTRRHLLLVAERPGGAALFNALRNETSSITVVHVLVPMVPVSQGHFAVPFETGCWFPESVRSNGGQDSICRHRAARYLSEMQSFAMGNGYRLDGQLVDSELDRVVLVTFDRLESDLVLVLCCGSLSARWSARRLARRLRGRVPTSLVDER